MYHTSKIVGLMANFYFQVLTHIIKPNIHAEMIYKLWYIWWYI